ncbi:MAG: four helix bundle protein [Gemmatirosa sp.]
MPSRPTPRAASARKSTRRPSSPDVPVAVPPVAGADVDPPTDDGAQDPASIVAPFGASTLETTLETTFGTVGISHDRLPESFVVRPPRTDRAVRAAEPTAVTPLPPGYRGLRVWQKALELAGHVFVLSEGFPTSARDSMAVPMRRASAAIPAAIAEGNVRYTPREYAHYLSQALGTVAEVETLLFLSVRLGLATDAGIAPLLGHCVELGRMLRALTRSVQVPRAPIADRPTRRRAPTRE